MYQKLKKEMELKVSNIISIVDRNIMMEYLIKWIDINPVIATYCLSKIIEDLKFNSKNISYYGTDSGL